MLTDLRMPKMDGIALPARNARCGIRTLAVVMITAVADVDVAVSCLAVGAMDYLTKPFNIEEVRARVAAGAREATSRVENRRAYQEQLEERVQAQAHRLEELFLGDDAGFCRCARGQGSHTPAAIRSESASTRSRSLEP